MNYMKLPPKVDFKKVKLPIGTRIKFTKELSSGPDEFSPGNLYAEKDSTGVVYEHGGWEGHMVKWDKWNAEFGAIYGEEFVIDYEYYRKNNISISDWLSSNSL